MTVELPLGQPVDVTVRRVPLGRACVATVHTDVIRADGGALVGDKKKAPLSKQSFLLSHVLAGARFLYFPL